MKMNHFVGHDLSEGIEMPYVPRADRDDVFIRSDISRVMTLLFGVFCNSELMYLRTRRKFPFTKRGE